MEGGSSHEACSVEVFLRGAGLAQYCDNFIKHGYDTMEVVRAMGEDQMKRCGMLDGHALRICLALKQSQTEKRKRFAESPMSHDAPQLKKLRSLTNKDSRMRYPSATKAVEDELSD